MEKGEHSPISYFERETPHSHNFDNNILLSLFYYCYKSLTVSNLSIKLYHNVCIGKKNIVHMEFETIHSFRHPLGVLERIPHGKEGTSTFQKELLFWLGIHENQILGSHFSTFGEWKNFPQSTFWLHAFQNLFLFHYSCISGAGYPKRHAYLNWPPGPAQGDNRMTNRRFLRVIRTPEWPAIT